MHGHFYSHLVGKQLERHDLLVNFTSDVVDGFLAFWGDNSAVVFWVTGWSLVQIFVSFIVISHQDPGFLQSLHAGSDHTPGVLGVMFPGGTVSFLASEDISKSSDSDVWSNS